MSFGPSRFLWIIFACLGLLVQVSIALTLTIETTVDELYTFYEKDPVASDQHFKDRRLVLTDCVIAHSKRDDWAEATLLSIYSKTRRDAVIHCYLFTDYDSSFAEEDEIIIRGKCTGKYTYITLIQCVLKRKESGEDGINT